MNLSTKQNEFLEAVVSGSNVFLTGKAGTGKSFVVKEAIKTLNKKGRNVVALAPTGLAANNIGGQTAHSLFALDPFGVLTYKTCRYFKSEKRRLIAKIDTIFLDEVSMVRPDILDAINWTMIKNGCGSLKDKQIIFIGDLKQLPIVVDDNMRSVLLSEYDDLYFYNAKIYDKLAVQTIELDEILRQSDPDFINALNTVREGGKSEYFRQFVGTSPKGVILAPHNSTVQQYNVEGLSTISSPEFVHEAQVIGNVKADDFNLESRVVLKNGCRIMYLINSKNNSLYNGAIGVYHREDDKDFIVIGEVKYALDRVELHKMEYVLNEEQDKLELREIGSITQIPVRLAYALSIHKSQGMTFDEVTVDLRRKCFQSGQMYVALSRVRTPQGLTIITN